MGRKGKEREGGRAEKENEGKSRRIEGQLNLEHPRKRAREKKKLSDFRGRVEVKRSKVDIGGGSNCGLSSLFASSGTWYPLGVLELDAKHLG